MLSDHALMALALEQAREAYNKGEVPIGALVVVDGVVLSKAHNTTETTHDATGHAELLALQAACARAHTKYLQEATLYTTLEPCAMCAMASFWLQVRRVVFAATDTKRGYRLWTPRLLHPKTEVIHGVCAQESGELLRKFFQKLRKE